MLVLCRREGESIIISENIEVTVLNVRGNRVRIGIRAPRNIPVCREEIILNCANEPGFMEHQVAIPCESADR